MHRHITRCLWFYSSGCQCQSRFLCPCNLHPTSANSSWPGCALLPALAGLMLMGDCHAGNTCGGGCGPLPPPRHDALLLTATSFPGGLARLSTKGGPSKDHLLFTKLPKPMFLFAPSSGFAIKCRLARQDFLHSAVLTLCVRGKEFMLVSFCPDFP